MKYVKANCCYVHCKTRAVARLLARDVFEDSTFETKVKAKSRPVPFRIRMVIGVRIRVLFLFDYCNLWLKWKI